jgi:hypothetical protein
MPKRRDFLATPAIGVNFLKNGSSDNRIPISEIPIVSHSELFDTRNAIYLTPIR